MTETDQLVEDLCVLHVGWAGLPSKGTYEAADRRVFCKAGEIYKRGEVPKEDEVIQALKDIRAAISFPRWPDKTEIGKIISKVLDKE